NQDVMFTVGSSCRVNGIAIDGLTYRVQKRFTGPIRVATSAAISPRWCNVSCRRKQRRSRYKNSKNKKKQAFASTVRKHFHLCIPPEKRSKTAKTLPILVFEGECRISADACSIVIQRNVPRRNRCPKHDPLFFAFV